MAAKHSLELERLEEPLNMKEGLFFQELKLLSSPADVRSTAPGDAQESSVRFISYGGCLETPPHCKGTALPSPKPHSAAHPAQLNLPLHGHSCI